MKLKKVYLYIAIATILFSSMEIALKMISGQFNPIQITLLRFSIGSIVLTPFAVRSLKVRGLSLNRNDLKFFIFNGFICILVSMTLYQMAILHGKASIVAIIFSCNPVFVVPLAHYILKEKVYKTTVISTIISILGMVCILNPFYITGSLAGIGLSVLSAVTFALYSVLGKAKSEKYGGIVITCLSFIMGSVEMFILVLLTRIDFISAWLKGSGLGIFADIPIFNGITLHNIPNIVYVGIFVTGLGYTFYFLAMEKTSAATASIVFFIKPAIAPLLALIIINESIAPNTIAGIVLIIISATITFISNSSRSKQISSRN